MKRIFTIFMAACLLTGCAGKSDVQEATAPEQIPQETVAVVAENTPEIPYVSQFEAVTEISLSDTGIAVNGSAETETVFTSQDIIYYEDKEAYESGNPYGEGEEADRHTEAEAAAHTVVNITAPGAYRLTGQLSKGQIRIDLGEDAYGDPNAVVELILSDADITCAVAPAILFLNVYECDGDWSVDTAKPEVDTSAAGANLILEGENAVNGSHVSKIFKDQAEEKKLWKQDGAIYSYMSMNVYGPGKLDLTADNEGLDTQLHLSINGGNIAIRSQNDGINTNEDGVSVTTINAGNLHIIAGLGAEGDGIDSNGYLVINGGTVVASANPGADAGMDSDLGSYIHGGSVIAMGSTMDWAESDSEQVTMNLQFAANQSADAAVAVTGQNGTVLFAYDPGADEVLADNKRVYSGAVISCANFQVGETYKVYVDGEITGREQGGVYDPTTVTAYENGIPMAYTGTDVRMGPGGMGFGGGKREDFDPEQLPEGVELPEGEVPTWPEGEAPTWPDGERPHRPEWEIPEGKELPADFDPDQLPEDFDPGQIPEGMELPQGGRGDMAAGNEESAAPTADFYMQDKVNFFSGLVKA